MWKKILWIVTKYEDAIAIEVNWVFTQSVDCLMYSTKSVWFRAGTVSILPNNSWASLEYMDCYIILK